MTVYTRRAGATGYYLGRPAAFWLTVLAPRSAAHEPPRGTGLAAERHEHQAPGAVAAQRASGAG